MKLSRRVILIIIIFFNFIFSFSEDKIEVYPPYLELEDGMKIPQLPTDDLTEVDLQGNIIGKRELEKNTTVYLESRVNVFVPLEIISDIDIEAIILDNQKLEIPFEVEFNKVPEKKDYYKLCYSETEIDIDQDGKTDTFIYSSPFINTKIKTDNILYIDGENISKEDQLKGQALVTMSMTLAGIFSDLRGGFLIDLMSIKTVLLLETLFSYIGLLISFYSFHIKRT